jgi:DNA-binding NarL/FixJ family response regulator
MLYNNLVIIIVGILLILISLYFIAKQGKQEEDDYYLKSSLLKDNDGLLYRQQETMNTKLISVSEELEEIKAQLVELRSLQQPNQKEEAVSADREDNSNFSQALNYQSFLKRNDDIIKLYSEGRSIEEISKMLNKSFREVEMIIKLVK